MVIQVTLPSLMLFMVYALGIAAGILLIPILWNIKKLVGTLRQLVEANAELIARTIRPMPDILENVDQISQDVRATTGKIKGSVPSILIGAESVTSAAKESMQLAGVVMGSIGSGINETVATYRQNTPGLMAYISIFEEVLQVIERAFPSKK